MSNLRSFNSVHGMALTVLDADGSAGWTTVVDGLPGELPPHVHDLWFGPTPPTQDDLEVAPPWDFGMTCLVMDPVFADGPEQQDGNGAFTAATHDPNSIRKYCVRLYNLPREAVDALCEGRQLAYGIAIETWTPAPPSVIASTGADGSKRELAAAVIPRLTRFFLRKVTERPTGTCYDLVGVTAPNPQYVSLCYPNVQSGEGGHRIFGLIADAPDATTLRAIRTTV